MGKKIALIIISVVGVLSLILLVFLNSRIVKADSLGAPHYIKYTSASFGQFNLLTEEVPVFINHIYDSDYLTAPNGKLYNYTGYIDLHKVFGLDDVDITIAFLLNLPENLSNDTNVLKYVVYTDFGFEYPFRLPLKYVADRVTLVLDENNSYHSVILWSPSYFLFELNGLNFVRLFEYSFAIVEVYRPDFDFVDGDFAISDVGDMIYNIFIGYPGWIISFVSVPLGWLGGGLKW